MMISYLLISALLSNLSRLPTINAYNRHAYYASTPTVKSVHDPIIKAAANFAVKELKELSDSGIYRTLSLESIQSASTEIGDFHYMLHLSLALNSPYYKSNKNIEIYDVIVLESIEKDVESREYIKTIAIDTFPIMKDDAIERFWIEKVEKRRAKRQKTFQKWIYTSTNK